jgi:hypothetical protein
LQHRQIGEGFQEGVLRNLHRVVDIAEEAICDGDGWPLISEKQFVEGRGIAVTGLADKIAVAQSLFFGRGWEGQV